jgi:hypothetical protein
MVSRVILWLLSSRSSIRKDRQGNESLVLGFPCQRREEHAEQPRRRYHTLLQSGQVFHPGQSIPEASAIQMRVSSNMDYLGQDDIGEERLAEDRLADLCLAFFVGGRFIAFNCC